MEPPSVTLSADGLLSSLQQGAWLFTQLVPPLRDSLEHAVAQHGTTVDSGLPLFLLASLQYRRTALPHQMAMRFTAARNTAIVSRVASLSAVEERAYWEAAFCTLAPRTVPCAVSDADIEMLEHATQQLDRHVRIAAATPLSRWIEAIAPFAEGPFRSASHPHYLGCIFLRLNRSPEETALSLAHELAHQELFLLNLVDRLIVAAADYRLVHAPFQGRERPSIGRLHSAHALFRMVDHENATADPRRPRHVDLLQATIDTFQPGDLTALGRRLVYEVYQAQVDRLRGDRQSRSPFSGDDENR
ncbi:MAG: hypothetical protein HY696_05360 [Deltaproteobacteria bacterium]|nr:hypothetical protein [Deltaproteobacteria bacterium]